MSSRTARRGAFPETGRSLPHSAELVMHHQPPTSRASSRDGHGGVVSTLQIRRFKGCSVNVCFKAFHFCFFLCGVRLKQTVTEHPDLECSCCLRGMPGPEGRHDWPRPGKELLRRTILAARSDGATQREDVAEPEPGIARVVHRNLSLP